jgi:putative tryptophan/tyrosine transport system substrate-binding protein
VVPGLSHAAALWNPGNSAIVFSWKETQGAARVLGLTLQSHEVQGPKDFAAAFAAIAEERPNALLVLQDAVTMQQRSEIIDFAIKERLPSMFQEKGWAEAGGPMSYGENLASMYRRAAYFVDRIFKGTKPADLPVEQATKFDMALNLRTAKAIGLTIPDSILALANDMRVFMMDCSRVCANWATWRGKTSLSNAGMQKATRNGFRTLRLKWFG